MELEKSITNWFMRLSITYAWFSNYKIVVILEKLQSPMDYLDLKHGNYSKEENDLILKIHSSVHNKKVISLNIHCPDARFHSETPWKTNITTS